MEVPNREQLSVSLAMLFVITGFMSSLSKRLNYKTGFFSKHTIEHNQKAYMILCLSTVGYNSEGILPHIRGQNHRIFTKCTYFFCEEINFQ